MEIDQTTTALIVETTIADAEIIYEDIETKLVYIKFFLENSNEFIVIATTRPELLFACQVVTVNPDDERYIEMQEKTLENSDF